MQTHTMWLRVNYIHESIIFIVSKSIVNKAHNLKEEMYPQMGGEQVMNIIINS